MKTKPKKPLRGKPLLRAAWNFIAEHPEKWGQEEPFVTNRKCCLLARAVRLARIGLRNGTATKTANDGVLLCGIKPLSDDRNYLFNACRTMPELRARVVKICGARGLLPVPKAYL